MSKKEEYTPILPYDITYGENHRLYDNMKYSQDKDLCGGKDSICMSSGKVCKYYRTKQVEPYKLGNKN